MQFDDTSDFELDKCKLKFGRFQTNARVLDVLESVRRNTKKILLNKILVKP